ncbi:hypothetical protein [Lacticaseibacillus hulanensis]|uniref:hypothetical protein n=1 Tax=Lacticaseibacillus hulanensis TaxID=2493111 RepID=UPI000FDBC7E2|nr:hypothetical protein [Lacticaseibacillus hulanensis]
MELFFETETLHAGRFTSVRDGDNRGRFVLRQKYGTHGSFQLLNTDNHILGSVNPAQKNRYEININGQGRGTLIRMVGETHPLYMLRGANWLVSGNMTANHYRAYRGFEAVFASDTLASGLTMRLWCNTKEAAPASLLTIAVLDQIRQGTIMKQQPLSFSY